MLKQVPDCALRSFLRRYLDQLRLWQQADASVKAVNFAIGFFIRWAYTRGIQQPREVNQETITAYQRWLTQYRTIKGKPLRITSQLNRLVHLHTYFRWLCREGHILLDPTANMAFPKKPFTLPRGVLDQASIERVLAVPNTKRPVGLRDRAMLELLYSTGVRRAELAALQLGDLDLDAGFLRIHAGKGNRDRRIPMGKRAVTWVEAYLRDSRPALAVGEPNTDLFLTTKGTRISVEWTGSLVRRHLKKAGYTERGACHVFRHSMATHMHDGGADIRYVQAQLGHASLAATEIYTHVAIRKLKEVHAATHPAAKLRKDRPDEEKKDEAG